ncbi:Uncharacterized protein HZ326_28551 [Fusarium oxysporum f. sp. albedinis]|nr:Uncharacterized protein HZ326_28551 [Fusarium oxysporum f. sp. albedinis]
MITSTQTSATLLTRNRLLAKNARDQGDDQSLLSIDDTVYMTTWRQHHAANGPVRQPCSASWFRIVEDRPHKQGVARHYQRPLSRGSKLRAEMAFEARTAHPTLLWALKRHLALWGRSARG